jgi:hypothetical protein
MKKTLIGMLGITLTTAASFAVVPDDPTRCGAEESLGTIDAVDIALDFVPGINIAKDLICIGMGTNPVTGDEVGESETTLLVGTLIFPWAASRLSRAVSPRRRRRLTDTWRRLTLRLSQTRLIWVKNG